MEGGRIFLDLVIPMNYLIVTIFIIPNNKSVAHCLLTVCEDDPKYADGCPRKAAVTNYCTEQEEFMRRHCAKSCKFCSEACKLKVFLFHQLIL